ncbi:MAG TPA: hypothetical protein VHF22_07830 [Planctomycetota bacterium]|nr:hypothetical protein [Planctomycetota bacterium]
MRRISLFAVTLSLALAVAGSARATTITSQVGTPAATGTGPGGLGATLTGLWATAHPADAFETFWVNDASIAWTHAFAPILGTIDSATLDLDIIDADGGVASVYAGSSASGTLLGTLTGPDTGGPDPWQGSTDGGSVGRGHYVLPAALFPALAAGSISFFLDDAAKVYGIFGMNAAVLTVQFTPPPPPPEAPAVPEPAGLALAAAAAAALALVAGVRPRL